ncbi:6-aminohexanoate-cyclic-dimer hydrolase [compost metagenome]
MAGLQAGKVFTAIGVLERVATREKQLGRAVRADELEAVNLELLEAARRITAEQIRNAQEVMLKVRHQMAVFMRDHDLILSPTVAAEPPLLGVLDLSLPPKEFGAVAAPYSAFTRLFNVTGQPAMSVPLFWSDSGLPVGVMFAGRFGEERTLIRLAAQLEQAHPWFNRLPSV